MAFHGYVRATNDIDLWIKNTPQNMDALRQALIETGIKEAAFMKSTTQLLGGFTMFNLLESDLKIDLLHNLKLFKEVDFDLCYSKATISDYAGIQIPVIHVEDLLTEKKQRHGKKI